MMASAALAPCRRLSRSSSDPRCTSAPSAMSDAADASERASPSTSCPAASSSFTTADPCNKLGQFLKDRRSKLDPETFGYQRARRRTPGLRREEVALRANVSVTWYTWLEQGRGGAPSAAVLDRVARALLLTDAEREHLFLLALGRPPEVRYQAPGGIDAHLQRVLDALEYSPAVVKTATWDVVAQNRAAATLMADFLSVEPKRRNVLRAMFCDARYRAAMLHWESCARFAVATFRADVTRAGA